MPTATTRVTIRSTISALQICSGRASAQQRSLLNAGALANYTYTKGIHNIKAGISYQQWFLNENDQLGIVDPTFNAPCLNGAGVPVNGFSNPSQCAGAGFQPNLQSNPNATGSAQYPYFNPVLLPYDLTRGGVFFPFAGHTDVKEFSTYVQDTINWRKWSFNLGLRGDIYNGLASGSQAEPRVGVSYNIARTNTILRFSYARALETPFNENLVLSSIGCALECAEPASRLLIEHDDTLDSRHAKRIPCWTAAGLWTFPCCGRRIHLEVHEPGLRLQRAG